MGRAQINGQKAPMGMGAAHEGSMQGRALGKVAYKLGMPPQKRIILTAQGGALALSGLPVCA
jgi:hypothetical protein